MTSDDIQRILTLIPELSSIKFQGLGEPLLTKGLPAILELLQRRNIRLWTISNGTTLKLEKHRNLLLNYFKDVTISIDSVDPELFGHLRPPADLDSITTGIHKLVLERNEQGAALSVGIIFCVSHENFTELPSLADVVLDLGVDYLSIGMVENWAVPEEPHYHTFASYTAAAQCERRAIDKAVAAVRAKLLRHGVVTGFNNGAPRLGNCYWPFRSLFITVEGIITPCCIRMDRTHGFGSIYDIASLEELWHGKAYQDLRHAHITKDTSCTMCGRCPC